MKDMPISNPRNRLSPTEVSIAESTWSSKLVSPACENIMRFHSHPYSRTIKRSQVRLFRKLSRTVALE
jgi:hypothetical protein